MWEFRQHRVCEDFDAAGTEQYQAWRAEDAGLPLVTLFRTEYARWEDPDAAGPGVLMVAWELVERDCKCDYECCGECCPAGYESIADALGGVLEDWNVRPTSVWEASGQPWDRIVGHVWVSATETYEYERDTRYEYSLHVKGVSAEVRERIFGAVGVEEIISTVTRHGGSGGTLCPST